ncbi:MAG: SDR family oxidoreductase [Blastocatellia bacterium]
MILVTGASGTVGRAVLAEVSNSGKPVRAMYRSKDEARKAPSGVSAVIADFASTDTLTPCLSGVDSVYLVCSPVPSLVELENNVIDVSQKSGVKHIVLNSALGAEDYPKSFPAWHRKVEDKLKASGLGYTILRPNSFLQNILAFYAPSIRAQGAFYSSMGDARTSFLDVRDIAVVAAKALTSPAEHAGKVYELNGPEAVTYTELAARISTAANRSVNYVDIPEEAQRRSMLDLGMPEWQVTALLDLQMYYKSGKGGQVDDLLPKLLGRPPMNLNRFLSEFKDEFRSQAQGA